MLKIHVVRQGGHRYYVDDLVPGRAEGTGVAGESPGFWTGRAATALGVAGTVGPGDFGEVLEGRHPGSGAALRMSAGTRSVAGYDLTFCAPKSVSILHLLGPAEMADQVGRGHACAVAEATDYLQREATGVRRTRHGQTSLQPAVGVVAGSFVHRTSRALDPHLHTHLVVANVTQGVDGVWSSVDGRRMFAHVRAVQALYHARLRLELSDRLGASWDVRPSGLGDVVGVDATMRRLFSQRSAGIDEYLAGETGYRARPSRRRAFHATRPDKDRVGTVEDLVAGWKQRAADFGFDLGDLTRVVGPRRVDSVGRIDGERLQRPTGRVGHPPPDAGPSRPGGGGRRCRTAGVGTRAAEQVAAQLIEAAGPPVPIGGGGSRRTLRVGRGWALRPDGKPFMWCESSSTARTGWRRGSMSARSGTPMGWRPPWWADPPRSGHTIGRWCSARAFARRRSGRPPLWTSAGEPLHRPVVVRPVIVRRLIVPCLIVPSCGADRSAGRMEPICRSDGRRCRPMVAVRARSRPGSATAHWTSRGPAESTPVGCARRRPARDRATRG